MSWFQIQQEGLSFYNQGRLEQARDCWTTAVAILERDSPESLDLAYTYNLAGLACTEPGQKIFYFTKALTIQEQMARDSLDLAYTYHNLGIACPESSQKMFYYYEALAIYELKAPHSLDLANIYRYLGSAYYCQSHLGEALCYYKKAVSIQESQAPGSLELARTYLNLGSACTKPNQIVSYYKKAMVIREQQVPGSLDLANIYFNLGVVYAAPTEKAGYFEKALLIQEQLAPNSLELARTYHNLGAVCADPTQTIVYYKMALSIREQQAPGSMDLASTYYNLGLAYCADEPSLKASYFKKSLVIYEQMAPNSLALAGTYYNLGLVCAEPREKIMFCDKALAIQERQAPNSLPLAGTYYNLGLVCEESSQKINYFNKALAIQKQRAPDSLALACTYHNLAILYDKANQPSEAKQYHEKACFIHETNAKDSIDWANAFSDWADEFCDIGNVEASINYYSLALAIYMRQDANHPNVATIQEKIKFMEIGAIRVKLRNAMHANGADAEPVEIPLQYVDLVNTDKEIGKGYFGAVLKGYDSAIDASFAIKVIHKHLLEQSNTQDVEHARRTFRQEIKTLRQFRHPHIAKLFGYHLSDDLRSSVCLIFELAEKGSLDKFWADDFGRSQLSWKQRLQIALDVATALSYLHNGGDGIQVCYHRDIKSANICLNRNFQAQLIDCGLSKFVIEDDLAPASSASRKAGTSGYICPRYNNGTIPYGPKCEVFSFGVVLMELIIGRLQNYQETPNSNKRIDFSHQYVMNRQMNRIEDNFDKLAGDWEPNVIRELSALVLQCMDTDEDDRPSMLEVVEKLQIMVSNSCRSNLNPSPSYTHSTTAACVSGICRMCNIQSDSCLPCNNVGSPPHLHCTFCLDRHVRNKFGSKEICCPMDGCDSEAFTDEQLCGIDSWSYHVTIRNNNERFLELQERMERIHKEQLCVAQTNHGTHQIAIAQSVNEARLANMNLNELHVRTEAHHIEHVNVATRHHSEQMTATAQSLAQLQSVQRYLDSVRGMMISVYARVVERCPRLFVLVKSDKSEPLEFYKRSFLNRMATVSARLYFVCAHSYELVEPPIILSVTKKWWFIAEPAINVALALLVVVGEASLGNVLKPMFKVPIPELDLKGKDDNMTDFVKTAAKVGAPATQTAEELFGNAYELMLCRPSFEISLLAPSTSLKM